MAALLMEKGAEVDNRNEYQFTPLHYAALGAHESVVAALLKGGADKGAKDMSGMTPKDYASTDGVKKML